MQRLTNRVVGARAGVALAAYLRRPALSASTFKRAVSSVFAVGIILGISGRGQFRESLGAEASPPATGCRGFSTGVWTGAKAAIESETESLRAGDASGATQSDGCGIGCRGASRCVVSCGNQGRRAGRGRRAVPRFQPITSLKNLSKKLLQERLHLLEEHASLTLALKKSTSPESSPERQADRCKAELKQLQAVLAQTENKPETLLPPSFVKKSGAAPAAVVSEMKDAIEATTHDLGDWKNKAEKAQRVLKQNETPPRRKTRPSEIRSSSLSQR